ncbi:MAG: hypothetical protein ACFFD2_16065, partial [Promethearchaeota archaeon]
GFLFFLAIFYEKDFQNRYAFCVLVMGIVLILYGLLSFFLPKIGSVPEMLDFYVTAQKIVTFSNIINTSLLSYGSWRLTKKKQSKLLSS